MRQYNRNGASLSPRSLASALAQGPPYSLVNNGTTHTREAYRDLLVFEERLKQNSERLASQRRKYEAFLLSLILSIFILSYNTFISPSNYTIIQFLNSGLLLIGIVTLILFFATGVYSEKIAYAYKFVPQANRALRYFNIYLNTKKQPRQWKLSSLFYNPLNLFRIDSTSSELSRDPSSSGLRTKSRSRSPSTTSSTSFSSTLSGASSSSGASSPSSPTSSRQVIQLNPLPPSSNPRGELIFSSKVSTAYRDGYEKYRSDWEKRRRIEKARKDREENSGVRWLISFVVPKSWLGNRRQETVNQVKEDEKTHDTIKKRKMEKRDSVAYAATPSEYSDSSSVDHHSPSQSQIRIKQSDNAAPAAAPLSTTTTRGRNPITRPLVRSTSSSSSIASVSSSIISSNSPPLSRRPSPLRTGVAIIPITTSIRSSPIRTNIALNTAISSNGSSRATTPDLIPEEEDEQQVYTKYTRTNSGNNRGGHSPSETEISIASTTSSISIATSSPSQQSLLFSSSGSSRGRSRYPLPSATNDESLISDESSIGTRSRKSRRSYGDGDEDDEDDASLKSPPDMSPPTREAALRDLSAGNMHNTATTKRRKSRAGSFNEFLAELREDGI